MTVRDGGEMSRTECVVCVYGSVKNSVQREDMTAAQGTLAGH